MAFFSFDGTSWLSTPNTPDLGLSADLTMEADFVVPSIDSYRVMGNGGSGESGRFRIDGTTGKLVITIGSRQQSRDPAIVAGQRALVRIEWVAGVLETFLDDVLVTTAGLTATPADATSELRIGARWDGTILFVGDIYSAAIGPYGQPAAATLDADDLLDTLTSGRLQNGQQFTTAGRVWTVNGEGIYYTGNPPPPLPSNPAYLVFPGTTGNYLTCDAVTDPAVQLDVTAVVRPDVWQAATQQSIVGQIETGSVQWSWRLNDTTEAQQFIMSTDGTVVLNTADTASFTAPEGFIPLEVRYNPSDGSTLFPGYGPPIDGTPGEPFPGTASVEVGTRFAGTDALFKGAIASVEVAGVFDLNPLDAPAAQIGGYLVDGTTWTDQYGNTWTVHGSLIRVVASQDTGPVQGWRVELGVGDPSKLTGTALWDEGLWDVDRWGSVAGDNFLVDVTSRVQSLTTDRGRRRLTGRFKPGMASIVVHNNDGVFTPDGGATLPGVVTLQPGRAVKVTKDGADVFYGFVDTMDDQYNPDGSILMRITAFDVLNQLATNTRTAVVDVGAGDTTLARIQRIRDRALPELGVEGALTVGDSWETMQATTLAQDALSLMQVVSESEGGGLWATASRPAAVKVVSRNWFSDKAEGVTDWVVGGASPIKTVGVVTERTMQRIINEAHMSRRGGTEQVAVNPASQSQFARRTHTRLDLENDNDPAVAELAQRLVDYAGDDRLRLKELSFQPTPGSDVEAMCATVQFGDTMLVTVESGLFTWAWAKPTQVFGVRHEVTPEVWMCTLMVDDSVFDQVPAAFDYGFDDGFDSPDAVATQFQT